MTAARLTLSSTPWDQVIAVVRFGAGSPATIQMAMHSTEIAAEPIVPSGGRPLVLRVSNVRKYFDVKRGINTPPVRLFAVDGVTCEISEQETLGLVGESGCGKSTLGRVIVGLLDPSEGRVQLRENEVHARSRGQGVVGALQMVFQDPAGSLNPRLKVNASVVEPLRARGDRRDLRARGEEMLERVGLPAELGQRYPDQLSGGQQQRVCIARALIARPDLVVFDEAISSLDVSLQSQVIRLISDLQAQLGSAYLFITHDLARAMELSDRIAIMYLGKIVEVIPAERFPEPLHPYSQALISAMPKVDEEVSRHAPLLEGDVPSAMSPPAGCRFHTRCPYVQAVCRTTEPELTTYGPGHWTACHFATALKKSEQGSAQDGTPPR